MASELLIQKLPGLELTFPASVLIEEATMFAKNHCDEFVYNHAVRCAYWALLILKSTNGSAKQPVDIDLVVITCFLHDLGLPSKKPGAMSELSQDRRFEVDGANIAKDFIVSHTSGTQDWDAARLDRLWMGIALHTTPSIGLHAMPEVAVANQAITADFAGPYWSLDGRQRPISVEEYRIVTNAFPRGDFNGEGLKQIMCGLCRDKPETTYDNFVGLFGRNFGCDGNGFGREEYGHHWEKNQAIESLLRGLDALDKLDI